MVSSREDAVPCEVNRMSIFFPKGGVISEAVLFLFSPVSSIFLPITPTVAARRISLVFPSVSTHSGHTLQHLEFAEAKTIHLFFPEILCWLFSDPLHFS